MKVYVFSYNRGQYLHNCVASLFKCIDDVEVTIIDDDSNDKHTIEILEKWSKKCSIVTPSNITSDYKLGGLYHNMNYAINDAEKKKLELVMFVQEDMQMVRRYGKKDEEMIDRYFKEDKNRVQYSPCFFKLNFKHLTNNRKIDESQIVYFKDIECQYSGVTDIGIFHVQRFVKKLKNFQNSERKMDNIAREKGIRKGEAVYPFIMYLPYPKSYRDKNRSLSLRVAEFISGAGYYPIEFMNEKKKKMLFDRDPRQIPYAEDFLTVNGLNNKPWSFAGGVTALYEQGGYKRIIGKIIKRLG